MKKTIFLLSCMTLFFAFPITSNAQTYSKISENLTLEGVYYEIFEIATSIPMENSRATGDLITVTREFRYSGIIAPPSQKEYYEIINNVTYSGTLYLSRFYFDNGNTIAVYTGTLTAKN